MNALLLLLLLTLSATVAPLHLLVRSLSLGRGVAARWRTALPSRFVSGFVLYSAKLLCGVPFVATALFCFIVSSDDAFHLEEAKKANVMDAKDHG
jgi:hypothetical protein